MTREEQPTSLVLMLMDPLLELNVFDLISVTIDKPLFLHVGVASPKLFGINLPFNRSARNGVIKETSRP